MLIDLISTDNMVSYNVKVANIMGLHTAIYLTELINISAKADKKNKLVADKYFIVDRDYIQKRTTLSMEEQLAIEYKLSKVNVLQKAEGASDTIYIDITQLANIISSEDTSFLGKVTKLTEVKTTSVPGVKQTVKQKQIAEMKGYITITHPELKDALEGWVEGVYARPNGFLSKKAVTIFQREVDNFAKGDLDKALKVVEIATVGGFRDASWAINDFNDKYAASFATRPIVNNANRRPNVLDEVF